MGGVGESAYLQQQWSSAVSTGGSPDNTGNATLAPFISMLQMLVGLQNIKRNV